VRESKDYTVTNRNDAERLVLIEHPVRNDFKLVDTDKPEETASDFYRFELKVPAGKTETKTVTEERVISQSVVFSNVNDQQIRVFVNSPVVSDKVKDAFKQAQSLRWEVAKTQRDIQELQRQLTTITQDQQRLRENLKAMPSTANAYKRYLDKFDEQETQIEKYQEDIKRLQGVEHSQQKSFEDFLAQLTVE
jgi:DNA repair exonuclease SbcCD ATPase subunit